MEDVLEEPQETENGVLTHALLTDLQLLAACRISDGFQSKSRGSGVSWSPRQVSDVHLRLAFSPRLQVQFS